MLNPLKRWLQGSLMKPWSDNMESKSRIYVKFIQMELQRWIIILLQLLKVKF